LKSEKILEIQKKGKLNSEKDMENMEENKLNSEMRCGKYGRNSS
jgi:hypothetical protein